ncbi:MAG: TIR domain-containing protein [Lachnospiraceae bacterium]|nr:TIR domain-containing protein [Lachnospiraceae bacterium]
MGKKIFVSYKYADEQVENLVMGENSTVRDYVDEFEKKLDSSDNIYKGESEGEDLSELSDDTIWEKLKDRIYDSSVTVVFISPGMRESWKKDRDQWIPWEVSYSLKETSRKNKNGDSVTSHSNAIVAVVLPDENGSYSYYLEIKSCCSGGCTMHHTNELFEIIRKNKFNRTKNASKHTCDNNDTIWSGTCSYIEAVKWSNFISNYQKYVNAAVERQEHIDEYDIQKEV